MRWKSILAACAALACVGLANPEKAAAFGHDRDQPAGWGRERAINHWVYYPRYAHNYHVDPYAYQYSPRGYYPYYNSGNWRSTHSVRERNHAHYNNWNVRAPRFKYQRSWGRPTGWNQHHHIHDENRRRHHFWHY